MDLPHDWSIEGAVNREAPAGNDGSYYPTGTGWYSKTMFVKPEMAGKRISLYFEGVYMNAEVFVNGQSLGVHPYGYTSFAHDITPCLHEGENRIAVRVDNSQQKNCRWYSGSGIYRNVWLLVTNPVHFTQWGIFITSRLWDKDKATVTVKTTVKNESDRDGTFQLAVCLSREGQTKKEAGQTISLKAGEERTVEQELPMADVE